MVTGGRKMNEKKRFISSSSTIQACGGDTCKNYEPVVIDLFFAKPRLEIMADTLPIWKEAADTSGDKPEWAYERYLEGCPFCEDAKGRRGTIRPRCGVCYLKKENPAKTCGLISYYTWNCVSTPANALEVFNELLWLRWKWEREGF